MDIVSHSKNSFFENPKAALADYLECGYHIESNLMSATVIDALIKESAQLQDAKLGKYRPCMMPHRQNRLYLNAMRNGKVVDIMSQIVSGPVVGLQTEFFYCPPETQGFSLHQDNFFVQAPEGAFASAWMALVNTNPERGGLIIYPGTHKLGNLPVEKVSLPKDKKQDPNANNEQTVVPEGYSPCSVTVPRGAVLFIHGNLVHGSHKNSTSDWRYVLLCTYLRAGESFRPGQYAQREEIDLCL